MSTLKKQNITAARNKFAFDLRKSRLYWYFSPVTASLYHVLKKYITTIKPGKVLDAGAGGVNGKILFDNRCTSYTCLDITNRTGEIDIVADIHDMASVATESYDTVFCSQVLEHVQEPCKAVRECHRILKSGGYFLVTVPHISHYHESPYDFYRYTHFGINHILKKSGFTIIKHNAAGGLASFILHPVSLIGVTTFWKIPVLKWIVFYLNLMTVVLPALAIDRIIPTYRRYPLNIVVLAQKN